MAFVTLEAGRDDSEALIKELRAHVGQEIGPTTPTTSAGDALPKLQWRDRAICSLRTGERRHHPGGPLCSIVCGADVRQGCTAHWWVNSASFWLVECFSRLSGQSPINVRRSPMLAGVR